MCLLGYWELFQVIVSSCDTVAAEDDQGITKKSYSSCSRKVLIFWCFHPCRPGLAPTNFLLFYFFDVRKIRVLVLHYLERTKCHKTIDRMAAATPGRPAGEIKLDACHLLYVCVLHTYVRALSSIEWTNLPAINHNSNNSDPSSSQQYSCTSNPLRIILVVVFIKFCWSVRSLIAVFVRI